MDKEILENLYNNTHEQNLIYTDQEQIQLFMSFKCHRRTWV